MSSVAEKFGPIEEVNEGPKIESRSVEELQKPIEKIMGQLRKNIDAGKYFMVIGDDASGRIPALVFLKVLKNLYEKSGFDFPAGHFFAGGDPDGSKLREIADELRACLKEGNIDVKNRKALLVTDYISSGTTIWPIARGIKEAGLDFDIATIGLEHVDDRGDLEASLGARILYGAKFTPRIYGKHILAGVEKRTTSLHAYPLRYDIMSESGRNDLAKSRKDVSVLADRITKWFERNT